MRAILDRRIVIAFLVVSVLFISIATVAAAPPSGGKGNSNEASLLLVKKDYSWNPVWPGAFGELRYKLYYDGAFEARLIVHGLEPNKWYLVTFDAPFVGTANPFAGSDGLFGVKYYWASWEGQNRGFIDVALFKTNEEGDANVIIPTTSGLTASDLLVGSLGTGSLAAGTYSRVKVAIKYVGAEDAAATRPDVGPSGLLMTGGYFVGGTPDARDYNLYETQVMETFTVA